MKGIFKRLAAIAVAAVTVLTMGISASAELADYQLDTSKAKKTMGGGQAFTYYLRNTNEVRKHGKHLDNAWITEDSEVIITYEYMGEIPQEKKDKGIEWPAALVLQCWAGELVTAPEQRWVEVKPTTWDDTTATFSYADILTAWDRPDLSEVYAFVIIDEGVSLTVYDMTITNVDIPEGVETVGLTKVGDDAVEVAPEETVTETEAVAVETTVAEITDADGNVVTENVTTDVSNVTEATGEVVESNNTMTIILIIAAVVVVLVVIIVIVVINSKKGNKKKGNYYV